MTITEFRTIETAAKSAFPEAWDCSSPDYGAATTAFLGVDRAFRALSFEDRQAVIDEDAMLHDAARRAIDLGPIRKYLERLASDPEALREAAMDSACYI